MGSCVCFIVRQLDTTRLLSGIIYIVHSEGSRSHSALIGFVAFYCSRGQIALVIALMAGLIVGIWGLTGTLERRREIEHHHRNYNNIQGSNKCWKKRSQGRGERASGSQGLGVIGSWGLRASGFGALGSWGLVSWGIVVTGLPGPAQGHGALDHMASGPSGLQVMGPLGHGNSGSQGLKVTGP